MSAEDPKQLLLPASEISTYSLEPKAYNLPAIHVVAGALFDSSRRILVAERPAGKHMAGRWEFPGGKVARNESPLAALTRELQEELGIEVITAERLICYEHEYSDRRIVLDLWHVTAYEGIPESCEGQQLAWVAVVDLNAIDILEADRPMVELLKQSFGR